jgi:hypothetical protein
MDKHVTDRIVAEFWPQEGLTKPTKGVEIPPEGASVSFGSDLCVEKTQGQGIPSSDDFQNLCLEAEPDTARIVAEYIAMLRDMDLHVPDLPPPPPPGLEPPYRAEAWTTWWATVERQQRVKP